MRKNPKNPVPVPCHCCGRVVSMRNAVGRMVGKGKARVRHKCPHGQWCATGNAFTAQHAIRAATCQICSLTRRVARGEMTQEKADEILARNGQYLYGFLRRQK